VKERNTVKGPSRSTDISPTDRAFWLAWSRVPEMGPVLIKRLQQHFGTLSQAWAAAPADLLAVEGIGLLTVEGITTGRRSLDPAALLAQHEQENSHFWTPADADYPRLLREIPDPPTVLYYRGTVCPEENLGQVPAVAIVGTRSPTDYGRRWTRRLTQVLVEQGFTIISGLAAGIDAEAHRSCLTAGGRTWAVMGTGVNLIYPGSNKALGQQILEQGLVVSEYPIGTQPDRAHFPRRNRIIAGLSRATLVLEAPQKSGALITARLANDYGRDVYILPGSLDNPQSLGCLSLLAKGAQPILGTDELLELLGSLPTIPGDRAPSAPTAPAALPTNLPPDLAQVLHAIAQFPTTPDSSAAPFDWLVQTTGLSASQISSALTQLEMQDLVVATAGMRYQRPGF
jgi:DNA processing protein